MNKGAIISEFYTYEENISIFLAERSERELCFKLFYFLTNKHSFKLNYATYGTLYQEFKCSKEDFPNLVKATDFLTTKNAHLLDMFFEYCDADMDGPEPVEKSVVHTALTKGNFYHPVNGEKIDEFRDYIYPVFKPSEKLCKFRLMHSQEAE